MSQITIEVLNVTLVNSIQYDLYWMPKLICYLCPIRTTSNPRHVQRATYPVNKKAKEVEHVLHGRRHYFLDSCTARLTNVPEAMQGKVEHVVCHPNLDRISPEVDVWKTRTEHPYHQHIHIIQDIQIHRYNIFLHRIVQRITRWFEPGTLDIEPQTITLGYYLSTVESLYIQRTCARTLPWWNTAVIMHWRSRWPSVSTSSLM